LERANGTRGSAPPDQTKAKHHSGPIAVLAHFLCWVHGEPKQKMIGKCLELRDKGGFSKEHELKTPAGQVRTTIFLKLISNFTYSTPSSKELTSTNATLQKLEKNPHFGSL
jgi:hypothetical protein